VRYFLVMPAAGSGRRFSATAPKQYAALRRSTVIELSLAQFEADAECVERVVVTAGDDPAWPAIAARRPRPILNATGGAERVHSVRAGLLALSAHARDGDWIFVHDAARPCFAPGDLARLKTELADHPVGGILATPVADTLKRAAPPDSSAPEIETTVERRALWRAATPQVFRYGPLLRALDAALAANRLPTDEAQAIEWAGGRPRLVPGRADNIKVTTADDLALAAAILHARESADEREGAR
jgi:2-C-methyl-D-erythritol 4-phosphate cytidylyltransferase